MRSRLLALVVASMVAVACGDGSTAPAVTDGDSTTTTAADAGTQSTPPTSSSSTAGTAAGGSSTTTTVDTRPVAPDFSLDLGSGGTFVLSEETRPVYLVFWAEW